MGVQNGMGDHPRTGGYGPPLFWRCSLSDAEEGGAVEGGVSATATGRNTLAQEAPEGPKFRTILVPLDFSKGSRSSLAYAIRFARRHGSRLILLHVVEPRSYPTTDGFTNFAAPPITVERDAALEELERWRSELVPSGTEVETRLRTGPAYYEIAEASRELAVDLIIISTHGYTGLKHVLMGSTAEQVVRRASCPVLTVRRAE